MRYNVHPHNHDSLTDRFLSKLEAFSRALTPDNGEVPLTADVSCNGDLVDQLGIIGALADDFGPYLTKGRLHDSADAEDCASIHGHFWG